MRARAHAGCAARLAAVPRAALLWTPRSTVLDPARQRVARLAHRHSGANMSVTPQRSTPSMRTAGGAGAIIVPSGAALGAEVRGVDLRALDVETFAAIRQAWLDHQVLLVRGQQLSDDDLIAFSRRFG